MKHGQQNIKLIHGYLTKKKSEENWEYLSRKITHLIHSGSEDARFSSAWRRY